MLNGLIIRYGTLELSLGDPAGATRSIYRGLSLKITGN